MDPKIWLSGMLYVLYTKEARIDAAEQALKDAERFLEYATWTAPPLTEKLTAHFTLNEFFKDGALLSRDNYDVVRHAAAELEAIRVAYGKPISVIGWAPNMRRASLSVPVLDHASLRNTVQMLRTTGVIGGVLDDQLRFTS